MTFIPTSMLPCFGKPLTSSIEPTTAGSYGLALKPEDQSITGPPYPLEHMANLIARRDEPNPTRLSGTEWDFSSVPDSELIGCFIWEYLRECPPGPKIGWRTRALILLWTFDTWEDRAKLNLRYKNIPKSVIASVAAEGEKRLPPWQEIDSAKRKAFAVLTPKRPPLIPLNLSRHSLWEWVYTFESEPESLEFGDWFKEIHEWMQTLDEKVRNQLEELSQQLLIVDTSESKSDASFDAHVNPTIPKSVDVNAITTTLKPRQPDVPMDLVCAKMANFVAQPDFLINWQEYDKPAIKRAFAKWLNENEPRHLKPPVSSTVKHGQSRC